MGLEIDSHKLNDWDVLTECGAVYSCPKFGGARLGPLVGYAGKYMDEYRQEKHYVGDVYYDCAKLEQYPWVTRRFADQLAHNMLITGSKKDANTLIAMPLGALAIGENLAAQLDVRYIFPEKKITKLATRRSREESSMIFSRHQLWKGDKVILAEDVVNNLSTPEKMLPLIEAAGAKLIAIACIINRSDKQWWNNDIPIVSVRFMPTMQYKQDDPMVASDVAKGNVVWEPKSAWEKLVAIQKAKGGSPQA